MRIIPGYLCVYYIQIEDHQPLEYLSEMRQVTIVFINLVIQECTNMELALVLQHAFDIIYTSCKRTQGQSQWGWEGCLMDT